MHPDQLHIAPDTARELIHTQFPQFAHEPITPLAAAGTVNAIFRIGSAHAARFPLQYAEGSAAQVQQEMAAMAALAAHCPFPTPRPVGLGTPGAGYPMHWLLQRFIEGETATPDGLSHYPLFAHDLARLVRALRSAGTKGRRFDGRGRGGVLADHDEWMAACFARSEGLVDVPRLRAMWTALRDLPPADTLVMSHRDLIPGNLLVRGDRLAGVLDSGSFGPADSALDLVAGWHLLDAERRQLFREAIGVSDLEWQRGAGWAFEQAMGLVWYYRDTNPTMSALGRSTLARLLETPVC